MSTPASLCLLAMAIFSLSSARAEVAPSPATEAADLPGVALAQGITQMTGVAISPLTGVSAMGAWHYFRTPESARASLPWFCHPAAWGTGFGLLLLCFLKDLTGPATPALIKKPLDAAELFENKISALVACGAFVPFVVAGLSAPLPGPESARAAIGGHEPLLAAIPFVGLKWILLPLSLLGFAIVWVVSHSVNVLILLSPFGLIGTVLKTARLTVLAAVAAISALSPVVGAMLCLILIAIAAVLAPRAFRFSVFGTVMAWDALASLIRRSPEPGDRLAGFLSHSSGNGHPARLFGWVEVDEEGKTQFVSRRFFAGPERRLALGNAAGAVLHRGLVYPSLSGTGTEGQTVKPFVALLPRYRPHLDAVARRWRMGGGVRDVLLVRGFKGAIAWVREALSSPAEGRQKSGV